MRYETNPRLVVLDRDGTINIEKGYLSDPAELELLPDAGKAIQRLNRAGVRVVVITNQSAVGRGYITHDTLDQIHARLRILLRDEGAAVDAFYYCPHKPDEGCRCRKPETALLAQALTDLGSRNPRIYVIGDQASDIEFGERASGTTILVRTGQGEETLARGNVKPHYICENLLAASELLLRAEHATTHIA